MKRIIPLCIILSLILSSWLWQDISISKPSFINQKNEESAAKHNWQIQRLRNPTTGYIPNGIRLQELNLYKNNSTLIRSKRGEEWRLRGPWNVGGRTRGMAIDVRDENHMIAGSVSGGIWKTTDGGNSWGKVSTSNAHPGIVSIVQDPRPGFQDNWFALSGEIYGTSASGPRAFYLGDGAFKSFDNGNTWEPITSTAGGSPNSFTTNFQGGWRTAINPTDGALFLATYGSIYRSVDSGSSWQVVLGQGNSSYFTDIVISKNGVVYAAMSSIANNRRGFYRSTDGETFINITPDYISGINRTVVEVDPNNDNVAYFLSELECDTCGGVTTTNYQGTPEYVSLQQYKFINGTGTPASGGGEWKNLSNNLPLGGSQFDQFNCQGGYDLCVRVQPGNSNNIIIGGTNLYRSTDGFQSPNSTTQIGGYGVSTALPFFQIYENHHPDQHDVYFSSNNSNILYSVSDGGIKKTSDYLAEKVQWKDLSLGYVTAQCYTVNIDEENSGDKRMMVGLQDNGNFVTLTDNPKQKWVMPVNGDGAFGYISPNNNFIVTSIQLGRIVKIEVDERGNLVRRRRIDPAGKETSDYSFIHPFAVDPNNDNIMYLPIGKKMYRLDNLQSIEVNNEYDKLEDTWIDMGDSITTSDYVSPQGAVSAAEISCLAISKSPANRIYVGTNNKHIYRIDNAHSNNPIWTLTDTLRLSAGGYVNDIAIDPDDADKVLISYSNYGLTSLFYSENAGNSWLYCGGTLERGNNFSGASASIRAVQILRNDDGSKTYFAGTSIGLYSTNDLKPTEIPTNNFTEWQQESPNEIGAAIVEDIKIRQSDGLVVAGTHGNGVYENYYRSPQNPVTDALLPLSLVSYPNPTKNILNYAFSMEQEGEIEIAIYNLSGQKVFSERKGLHTRGHFNYSMSLQSLNRGAYILRICNLSSKEEDNQKIFINK